MLSLEVGKKQIRCPTDGDREVYAASVLRPIEIGGSTAHLVRDDPRIRAVDIHLVETCFDVGIVRCVVPEVSDVAAVGGRNGAAVRARTVRELLHET